MLEIALLFISIRSHKIDYPEVTLLARKRLKEFSKRTKNQRHRNVTRDLVQLLERNAEFILGERESVSLVFVCDLAPGDVIALAALLLLLANSDL